MQSHQYDSIRQWSDGDFFVTTDRSAFDVDLVAKFLAGDSYWAKERTPEEEAIAAQRSRCYSVIHEPSGAMVGGARAVTDWVAFAWIADVFVLPETRGLGLGKLLVGSITEDLAHVDRLFLGTRDAHGLYSQFGFVTPPRQERWMERLL